MGEQKTEKVKKHICTGLLAHVCAGDSSRISAAFIMLRMMLAEPLLGKCFYLLGEACGRTGGKQYRHAEKSA